MPRYFWGRVRFGVGFHPPVVAEIRVLCSFPSFWRSLLQDTSVRPP